MGFSAVILAVGLLVGLLLPGSSSASVIISAPNPSTHDYKVAVAHFPLVDITRKDVYAATEDRKLMVSLFMPVHKSVCMTECEKAYMPPDTARVSNAQFFEHSDAGVFEQMAYMACCGGNTESINASKYPVVILEPQVGTSRLLYTTLARFMSANGVAVVLVDHPHDSSIVEFMKARDKPTIYNNGTIPLSPFEAMKSWNATITQAMETRTQDINFVLQQLTTLALPDRFPGLNFTSALNTQSYAIVGHGLGGTVATTLNVLDPRVRLSINLSGTAPLLQHPSAAQIYFFGRAAFTRDDDIHWPTTWPYLTGRATEFDLKDAGIFDYSDLPWLVDFARKEGGMPDLVNARGLGSLGPWGFHAMACFVEGVLRVEFLADWTAVSRCFGFFQQMVPYALQRGGA
ncbi:hypothetical protein P153DRAFT_352121 [Dothidotthia symphoricarpi CBS 119687]|uniref:1-alkyl-2-acetylglycerophosphocholine esterase n=1 Tax=Dothidotthia symphoricarpi CBS 119687 TaxID=1392245 RepID=A0A6A5ZVC7_9PLEO|nr:uncharacterized protein P153DRAFT_352121 [Dothidotthia symphoricarpi CBS 119687]KAF2123459.1 hypothetical protein P153DRAFT_352121 [Dothidotthia symphoricarpi CBS 119687]